MLASVIFIILAVGITMSAVLTAFVESAIKNPVRYGVAENDQMIKDLAQQYESGLSRFIFRVLMIVVWPYVLYHVLFKSSAVTAK